LSGADNFEFEKTDSFFMEELLSLVDVAGNSLTVFRIWVKKRSIAMLCTAVHLPPKWVGDGTKSRGSQFVISVLSIVP
jgi:hypothetical protein